MYKCVDKTVIPLEKEECVLLLYVWAVGEVWSAQLIYVAFGFFSNFFLQQAHHKFESIIHLPKIKFYYRLNKLLIYIYKIDWFLFCIYMYIYIC